MLIKNYSYKMKVLLLVISTVGLLVTLMTFSADYDEFNLRMRPSKAFVVPNIVHFIRYEPLPFTFIDAVCILAALKHQRPEKLFIHMNQNGFEGGKYWNVVASHSLAEGVLELKNLSEFNNKDFNLAKFSKAGVNETIQRLKLSILKAYGGIYLDNDCYIVRSLDGLRRYEMTVGWEKGGTIADAVIIASKEARFLQYWMKSYDNEMTILYHGRKGSPENILKRSPFLVNRVYPSWLAASPDTIYLVYLQNGSLEWRRHYVIHLFIDQQHLIPRNLSLSATYPVVFNETNILNYNVNIKEMVQLVYP